MRMPKEYPQGGPLYWRAERSGVLADAIRAYAEGRESAEQLRLVIDYCVHWADAPCWLGPRVAELRARGRTVRTRAEVQRWVWDLMAAGIDPF